jgi:hypothetical protein
VTRWYDYIAALFVADMLLMNAKLVLVGQSTVSITFAIFGVYAWWYIWNDFYTNFRIKQEMEKK